jgi:hypothetical protein
LSLCVTLPVEEGVVVIKRHWRSSTLIKKASQMWMKQNKLIITEGWIYWNALEFTDNHYYYLTSFSVWNHWDCGLCSSSWILINRKHNDHHHHHHHHPFASLRKRWPQALRQTLGQLLILSFARAFFYPEDGSDTFLRNVGFIGQTRCHIPEGEILNILLLSPIIRWLNHAKASNSHTLLRECFSFCYINSSATS